MTEAQKSGVSPRLPLLPLRNQVVFPNTGVSILVGRPSSVSALSDAREEHEGYLIVTLQKAPDIDRPAPEDLHNTGTLVRVVQMGSASRGPYTVLLAGSRRVRIREYVSSDPFFEVEYDSIETHNDIPEEEKSAYLSELKELFARYVEASQHLGTGLRLPTEIVSTVLDVEEPERLADIVAGNFKLLAPNKKQHLLEIVSLKERFEYLLDQLETASDYAEHQNTVKKDESIRDLLMNARSRGPAVDIPAAGSEEKNELDELEEEIRQKPMPDEVRERALRELARLRDIPPFIAEASILHNYLDWLLALPWHEYTEDQWDLKEAEKILDEDHYGLQKAKERILEYLAVQSLSGRIRGPILCFVGPPGTGKTSLAKSVARACGRNFVRIALGGVRDEAEIRGHRRTYVGAMPGKIIQALTKAKSSNPVMLLDEIDKLASSYRGDPAAALLEVLDPEQNSTFVDHYLNMDYDLSKVLFITTANYLHAIPEPLRDRMEIIELSGYTEIEKLAIAKKYLIPKQLEFNGLTEGKVRFTSGALESIVTNYTREAGVRNLERRISSILRKIAKNVVESGHKASEVDVVVRKRDLQRYLGVPIHGDLSREREPQVGVVNGLAVTPHGGELLRTEVAVLPGGEGRLVLTGKLGEVMQESGRAALSFVRSRARSLGICADFHRHVDLHIHFPVGAIPKDGPSAGITMAVGMVSALTGLKVRNDVAMTGEITLRGQVLPIGGLKSKLLAAKRNGILTVIIPSKNMNDLAEIPTEITKGLNIVPAAHMDDVLRNALVPEALATIELPTQPVDWKEEVGSRNETQKR